MLNLPDSFILEMKSLFETFDRLSEWPSFLAAFQQTPVLGIRSNTLKIAGPDLQRCLIRETGLPESEFEPVPWAEGGFYYPENLQPGKFPAYAAGLYYIQEPSAMLPAQVLAVAPGQRVLDLCAAPGGKATRIAADLQGGGLLWANEISAERARALLRNLELSGCPKAIITQETPERLAAVLPGYFDRILVDAPCSGSGMFRRDPAAIKSWLAYGSAPCAELQRSILEAAWTMLTPGGRLVYSTCSFSLAENEAVIAAFYASHTDCRILPVGSRPGVAEGLPLTPETRKTARIWPHLTRGEGHFCALLEKIAHADVETVWAPFIPAEGPKDAWAAFMLFCRQNLTESGLNKIDTWLSAGYRRLEQQHLHILPACPAGLSGLKRVKTGLFLGQVKELRRGGYVFEPSEAFILSLSAVDLQRVVSGDSTSDLLRRYLRGETLEPPYPGLDAGESAAWPAGAYAAVAIAGGERLWPLGWARSITPPLLKNLYPQGWRRSS
ncbi:MAG: RsmF rRNA methyltransferase first C-terminal domain-containing protein [Clostridiaceae bacterium]|nr:RsmF rRNA methyltransferase first C-terminal domain-containing protein [Clostridiaceae bacterium]